MLNHALRLAAVLALTHLAAARLEVLADALAVLIARAAGAGSVP